MSGGRFPGREHGRRPGLGVRSHIACQVGLDPHRPSRPQPNTIVHRDTPEVRLWSGASMRVSESRQAMWLYPGRGGETGAPVDSKEG